MHLHLIYNILMALAAFALVAGTTYTKANFPIGLPAINTYLMIGNGASPEIYAPIANVGDLSGPSMSATVVDVTSHSTGNPWREKLCTLLDSGDFTLPLYYIPDSEGPITPAGAGGPPYPHGNTGGLEALFTGRGLTTPGNPVPFAIQYPNAAQTTDYFQGFVSKFSKKAAVAGVEQAEVTITLTGMPTLS